jgi:hypothetical protein
VFRGLDQYDPLRSDPRTIADRMVEIANSEDEVRRILSHDYPEQQDAVLGVLGIPRHTTGPNDYSTMLQVNDLPPGVYSTNPPRNEVPMMPSEMADSLARQYGPGNPEALGALEGFRPNYREAVSQRYQELGSSPPAAPQGAPVSARTVPGAPWWADERAATQAWTQVMSRAGTGAPPAGSLRRDQLPAEVQDAMPPDAEWVDVRSLDGRATELLLRAVGEGQGLARRRAQEQSRAQVLASAGVEE